MSYFSAGELTSIESEASGFLPDTLEVIQITKTPDGAGGFTEETVVAASHACRLQKKVSPGTESEQGAQLSAISDWQAVTLRSAVVTVQDRVRIAGKIFEVAGTNLGLSDAVEQLLDLVLVN